MQKQLIKNDKGEKFLAVTVSRGDTAKELRDAVMSISGHYTQYGFAKYVGYQMLGAMPAALIQLEDEVLAMKMDEEGVYQVIDPVETGDYITI